MSFQHHSIHVYVFTYIGVADDAYSLHSLKITGLNPTPITKYGSKSTSIPWSKSSVAPTTLVSNHLPFHVKLWCICHALLIRWEISGRYQWKYEEFSCVVTSRGHFEIEQKAESTHMGVWHQGIHREQISPGNYRSHCPAYTGIYRHRENQWS